MERPEISRYYVFVIMTALVAVSCAHVTHRAGVEPGFNASVLYAGVHQSYDPPGYLSYEGRQLSGYDRPDRQVSVGYVWEVHENKRLMLAALVYRMMPSESYIPSLDIYYQLKRGKQNAGVGLIAWPDFILYYLWGRDIYRSTTNGFGTGIDLGAGLSYPSIIIQAMYSVEYEGIRASVFGGYRAFSTGVFCYEGCDFDDYLSRRWTFGVVFGYSPAIIR